LPRACAQRICSIASAPETCTISTGASASSASAIARCVASRSTGCGRDTAWYFGAVRPSHTSLVARHIIAS